MPSPSDWCARFDTVAGTYAQLDPRVGKVRNSNENRNISRSEKLHGHDNAKKPDALKFNGKGRIVIDLGDLGDLKGEAVRASRKRKRKLAP